jgi:hypothetical protein
MLSFFQGCGKPIMGRLVPSFQLEQRLHGRDHENGIARGVHGITAGVRVDAAGPLVHDDVNPVVGLNLSHRASGEQASRLNCQVGQVDY